MVQTTLAFLIEQYEIQDSESGVFDQVVRDEGKTHLNDV